MTSLLSCYLALPVSCPPLSAHPSVISWSMASVQSSCTFGSESQLTPLNSLLMKSSEGWLLVAYTMLMVNTHLTIPITHDSTAGEGALTAASCSLSCVRLLYCVTSFTSCARATALHDERSACTLHPCYGRSAQAIPHTRKCQNARGSSLNMQLSQGAQASLTYGWHLQKLT